MDGPTTPEGVLPPGADVINPPMPEPAPSSEGGITAQDAERAKAEKEAEFSKLMDTMEESVATQGQWFVKAGEKTPVTQKREETSRGFLGIRKTSEIEEKVGYKDTRALILRATKAISDSDNPDRLTAREYTVVTRGGIGTFTLEDLKEGDTTSSKKWIALGVMDRLYSGATPEYADAGIGYTEAMEGKLPTVKIGTRLGVTPEDYYDESKRTAVIPIQMGTLSTEDFQTRMQGSIELTESPHKAAAESYTKEASLARSATSIIQDLPPRQ